MCALVDLCQYAAQFYIFNLNTGLNRFQYFEGRVSKAVFSGAVLRVGEHLIYLKIFF